MRARRLYRMSKLQRRARRAHPTLLRHLWHPLGSTLGGKWNIIPKLDGRMNISAPFIRRSVATTLLTAAVALAGIVAYLQLPVSPLPQVDFPAISVMAPL